MAIKSNKYRKIIVDEVRYGWIVKPIEEYLVVNIEPYDIDGGKIQARIKSDIPRLWDMALYTNDLNLKVVTPGIIRKIIEKAISEGWDCNNKLDKRAYNFS